MLYLNRITGRAAWIAAGLVFITILLRIPARAQTTPEIRGFWVDAFHAGFKSPAEVDQLLSTVRACNMNTVVVQVRKRGDTYYPSNYEPWAADADQSFDALAYLIDKAHNGTPRIDVHAWFCMFPIWNKETSAPGAPNHVYNLHHEWLTQTASGTKWDGNNYWLDPGHPEVQEHTFNVIMDVVNRYDIDGIHYDYVRYSGRDWGYNPVSVARFNKLYNRTGIPASTDADWKQFRRDQVTAIVRKLYASVMAVKPHVKCSAAATTQAPGPASDSDWQYSAPYSNVLQDWRSWMEEGILDINMPMTYFALSEWPTAWDRWTKFEKTHKYGHHLAVGIGNSKNSIDEIIQLIWSTRQPYNGDKAEGQMFYSYYSPYPDGWGQAVNLIDYLTKTSHHPNAPYTSAVPVPVMPWKSSPTKGHLKGSVTYGGAQAVDGAIIDIYGPVNRRTKTDATGFYAFINLPPGSYTVKFTTSYGVRTGPAAVTAEQVADISADFALSSLSISNVQAINETAGSVTITWDTSGPSTSQVAFGRDKSCSSKTPEDTNLVSNHSVTVGGLQPFTAYFFKVISRNPSTSDAVSDVYAFITAQPKPSDIIIDNESSNCVFSGTWASGTSAPDKYSWNYRYCTANATPYRYATYTPNIVTAGDYNVYVWYPAGTNRTAEAPYTINYQNGSQTYIVNQQMNGGKWNLLGTKPFAAGTSGNVRLSNITASPTNVMADAVKFEYQPETSPPTVPTNLQAQVVSQSQVNLSWNASTDNVGVAGYRVYRDGNVVGIAFTNFYSDTELPANMTGTYTVAAFDAAGNRSGQSVGVSVCTFALPPDPTVITCNMSAGVWQSSNMFVFTAEYGFGEGNVEYYRFAWDQSPTYTWTEAEPKWKAGTLTVGASSSPNGWYLHLKGYNANGIPSGTLDLGLYLCDTTPPGTPSVSDDGMYTRPDYLRVTVNSTDPESGCAVYKYAIGSTAGGTDIRDWIEIPASGDIICSDLNLPVGTICYVSVQIQNGAGAWSGTSVTNGITAAHPVGTIAEAGNYAENTPLILENKIINANFGDYLFAQEPERFAAVRVMAGSSAVPGDAAIIAGRLSTSDGIATLTDGEITNITAGSVPLIPLGMNSWSIGGPYGPDNTGLLIRTAGQVTDNGSGWFTISDGGLHPVKIYSNAQVSVGDMVGVTGISLFEMNGPERIKVIKTRGAGDVTAY